MENIIDLGRSFIGGRTPPPAPPDPHYFLVIVDAPDGRSRGGACRMRREQEARMFAVLFHGLLGLAPAEAEAARVYVRPVANDFTAHGKSR